MKCITLDGVEEPCVGTDPPPFRQPANKNFLGAERGGYLYEHIERWRKLAESGKDVEIRDYCPSACTLVLSYIPKERLCFSATAVLGFHLAMNAKNGEVAMEASRAMYASYPDDIRLWLLRKGGIEKMPGPREGFWLLVASELWQMGYRKCEGPRPRSLR